MWTCGKNCGWISALDFSTNPHFRSIDRKIFFRRRTKSDGAFFLDSGWEALEKKVFFGAGKIREKRWINAVAVEFFLKNGTTESILHNPKL